MLLLPQSSVVATVSLQGRAQENHKPVGHETAGLPKTQKNNLIFNTKNDQLFLDNVGLYLCSSLLWYSPLQ